MAQLVGQNLGEAALLATMPTHICTWLKCRRQATRSLEQLHTTAASWHECRQMQQSKRSMPCRPRYAVARTPVVHNAPGGEPVEWKDTARTWPPTLIANMVTQFTLLLSDQVELLLKAGATRGCHTKKNAADTHTATSAVSQIPKRGDGRWEVWGALLHFALEL